MKSFYDLVKTRRSIRSYEQREVEHELIEKCLEAVRYAPTACNTQAWRFIVVEGELKDRLVEQSLGGIVVPNRWAKGAPVVVVIAMDISIITHRIGGKVKGIEYHLLDAGIAGEHFVLQAAEIGLGTCWIGWFDKKSARRVLKVPRGWDITAMITLGYPANGQPEKERRQIEEFALFKKK